VNGRVELITQAEYARRRGVAKSAVAKAVSEGRITLINGKVDPAVADIQWAQNTRARADSGRAGAQTGLIQGPAALTEENAPEGRDTPPAAADSDDYQSLRVRRERAAVESAERDNAKEAGRLVEREPVERATFDAFRALRDAVMSIPPRAAAKVVGMADARDIERAFTEELRTAFEVAQQRLLGRLPVEGG
jgi:hypothetical protein